MSAEELHEQAWALVAPHFQEALHAAIEKFGKVRATDRGTADLQEIITAAQSGAVEAMLIKASESRWGEIDADGNIRGHDSHHEDSGIFLSNGWNSSNSDKVIRENGWLSRSPRQVQQPNELRSRVTIHLGGFHMGSLMAVHIGGQSSQAEAEEHAKDESRMREFRGEKTRDFHAETLDEVLKIFDTLLAEKAEVKYLDFHAHGYEANIGLEKDSITLSTLPMFKNRGFHNLFVAGALIRILSCEFAGNAEGELMLAEFAQILLHGKGGSANAVSGACYFRPGLITSGKIKWDGRLVSAEVSNQGDVTLKGHFYLNPHRIQLTANALLAVLSSEIRKVGGRSRPPGPRGIHTVQDLVTRGIEIEKQERQKWIDPYAKSIGELRFVVAKVNGTPTLRNMQAASDMLEIVAARLSKQGVPVAGVVNQLVEMFSHGK